MRYEQRLQVSGAYLMLHVCGWENGSRNYANYVLIFNDGEFARTSPLCSQQAYSAIDRRSSCLLPLEHETNVDRDHRVSSVSVVATVSVLSRFSKHDIDMAKCSSLWPDDDEVVLSGEHSFRRPIICTIAICFFYESLRVSRYLHTPSWYFC